ncbi:methyltransferase domain-containing protein [Paraglaciecola aquimarina]|uniref:tRNA1(Val) (adenine(37)-N6)-methyltransferase n=1 Tax=Paraglaciecola aquimarina TaxID=1235557 RepID=A0ABU3SUB7_9ALTE|nr:methyltransferase [Paraglaciecola aquimarina]MDU0353611.1 methyltransferase domain-containing protein [Paraglaciecola aquimarina]
MKGLGFQFKQFFIQHARCAMKVGTDSIMLGSWINVGAAKHILDIGTGSGLLALMLAQKADSDCKIIGIDIEAGAIQQAKENALACPWAEKLNFEHVELQRYSTVLNYDLIVCNPPYFVVNQTANSQHSQAKRLTARQTKDLSHAELLSFVVKYLTDSGYLYCVLPAEVGRFFIQLAADMGLYCRSKLEVKSKFNGKPIRFLLQFSKVKSIMKSQSISIHQANGEYSVDYKTLCREYYLNF